jgi:hypothetical protein
MKKLILLLLLSIGLTCISYAGNLNKWTDDQLCGRMNNPPHLTHIVAEINMRGLYCDDGVAIKTVKTPITKDLILTSKLKRWKGKLKSWNKIIRGKKPIYISNSGTTIKVNPFGDEQSVILNKPF